MHCKPARALPSIGRHYKNGIGGRHHDLPAAQVHHPNVHTVLGPGQHLRPSLPKLRQDDLIENLHRYFADGWHLNFHNFSPFPLRSANHSQNDLHEAPKNHGGFILR